MFGCKYSITNLDSAHARVIAKVVGGRLLEAWTPLGGTVRRAEKESRWRLRETREEEE